ncbi:uncharacterized protein LOC131877267 isoform X2 [Tigriopus californicus]|uniref:uncharacterized protein LOC131877267 isoform X2 n=1 Tax=Tigriopus californicus TaxID=6832 RepID=UPI0027DA23D4|nr:uncharacterized protein LOC131877267 isoform X2 [Tigriopus californicus]
MLRASLLQDAMVAEFRESLAISRNKFPSSDLVKVPSDPSPESGNPGGMSPFSESPPQHHEFDHDGLVVPKKIYNPCKESKNVRNLNKEIKWNAKAGVNVLGTKSELEKVMEKRNRQRVEIEKKSEIQATKTDFQKVLEERAKKIEDLEKKPSVSTGRNLHPGSDPESGDSGHCSPEPEFVRVHAHLKHASSRSPSSSSTNPTTKTI